MGTLRPAWVRILQASAAYFAIAFGCGFVLGAFRQLVLEPRWGKMAAVLTEAPVMLVVSFFAARWMVQAFRLLSLPSRLFAGLAAFGLLMAAEYVLAVLLRGQKVAEFAAALGTAVGLVGLGAQVAFAVLPAVVGDARSKHPVAEKGV